MAKVQQLLQGLSLAPRAEVSKDPEAAKTMAVLTEMAQNTDAVQRWVGVEEDVEVAAAMQQDVLREIAEEASSINESIEALILEERKDGEKVEAAVVYPPLPDAVHEQAHAGLHEVVKLLQPFSNFLEFDFCGFVREAKWKLSASVLDYQRSRKKPMRQMHIRDGFRLQAEYAAAAAESITVAESESITVARESESITVTEESESITVTEESESITVAESI